MGQTKPDNINQMITITNHSFFVIFDEMTSSGLCESNKPDYIKRMITLSGTYFTTDRYCPSDIFFLLE
jgi:hypothetical protein